MHVQNYAGPSVLLGSSRGSAAVALLAVALLAVAFASVAFGGSTYSRVPFARSTKKLDERHSF